jgi:hypothetical protein
MTGIRKSIDEQIAEAENEVKQDKARVADLKAKRNKLLRSFETRRKVLIGAAVQAYANRDPGFGDVLERVILQGVTRDCDREVFPELFPDAATKFAAAQRPVTAPETADTGAVPS